MYDLIIIGGGPAAIASGIYANRKKIKTLLITDSFGGQSFVSDNIENWIGEVSISGMELAKKLENHLKSQNQNVEILENDLVSEVLPQNNGFLVKTKNNKSFETKYVLVTSGSGRKKLNIPGEKEFESRGVFYCSICDAPLMNKKNAVVIGGGNAGLEAVMDLIPYASQVYLLEYSDKLKGDIITQQKIKENSKVNIITSVEALEILGDQFVSGLKYKDLKTNEIEELKVDGVFVEIGSAPNSEIVKNLVNTTQYKEIIIDPFTQKTSYKGIWAAGDVTNFPYRQNNIAVSQGIVALLNIYDEINKSS